MIRHHLDFIHISDTHFGPEKAYQQHDVNTYQRARAVIKAVNDVASANPVDFIIHTGDVVSEGDTDNYDAESTALAADALRKLTTQPLYIVNGNHDDLAALARYFPFHRKPLAPGPTRDDNSRSIYFECKEHRFVILDARPLPRDSQFDPRGRFLSVELDALVKLAEDDTHPLTVFLHYPPIDLDCRWVDQMMLVQYADDQTTLHHILRNARTRIAGVFFGHVHRGVLSVRDGILYASVGATSFHFDTLPESTVPNPQGTNVAFFNYVTITERETLIKQHWVDVSQYSQQEGD